MSKWVILFLLTSGYVMQFVQAKEVYYLEGISFLGSIKKAYVVIDDEIRMPVEEGDELGQWVIKEIQQRAIILGNAAGDEQILELYSKLSITPEQDVVSEQIAAEEHTEEHTEDQIVQILQKMPDANPFAPRDQIADEDVPIGKRKISTPFGDFIVDDVPPSQPRALQQPDDGVGVTLEQAIKSTDNDNDAISSDYPVINTPFGDLTVNPDE